jgi:hypothetical protein
VDGKARDRAFSGTSENVGVGGMFVKMDRRLGVRERVLLHFTLPTLEWPISVLAEVRWVCEVSAGVVGAGFRFVGPSAGAIASIDDLVRKQEEDLTPVDFA